MTKFRKLALTAFKVSRGSSSKMNWFPGHMYKGLKVMMAKLSTVDCVIECHDARIPISGRIKEFTDHLGAIKPKILLLNKRDLADLSKWHKIKEILRSRGDEHVLLSDLTGGSYNLDEKGYTHLAQTVVDVIKNSDRYNRDSSQKYRVMIVGLPNVGKSTLINRLRQHHLGLKGEPATTGSFAGVTRHVAQNIKISSVPPIYVIDTPGIFHPQSLSLKEGYKLALCSTINDDRLAIEELAKYLFKLLNKCDLTAYINFFGMDKQPSCFEEFISYGAYHLKYMVEVSDSNNSQKTIVPDVDRVCWKFVKDFRDGNYGKIMLDDDLID